MNDYNVRMSATAVVRVSNRGQMSLPSEARHRWGIEDGGAVGVIDLDGALLLVPGGLETARAALRHAVDEGRYEKAVSLMTDPDLAN
jgi:AbrB family looped-hinge helix DNA binding protein